MMSYSGVSLCRDSVKQARGNRAVPRTLCPQGSRSWAELRFNRVSTHGCLSQLAALPGKACLTDCEVPRPTPGAAVLLTLHVPGVAPEYGFAAS